MPKLSLTAKRTRCQPNLGDCTGSRYICRGCNAFTLIELLIVVAIIAILAAIAVPNFLEAQVRAKVSAAKSALRTVATGLEAYHVDNNAYPYSENIGSSIWMPAGGKPRLFTPNCDAGGITSPVAYLTSIPNDPFKHEIAGSLVTAPVYFERAGFCVDDGVVFNGQTPSTSYPAIVPADAVGTSKLDGIGTDTPVYSDAETPQRYVLYSLGPDLDFGVKGTNIKSRFNLNNRYDSTNGTVTTGNIVRYPAGTSFP